MTTDEHDRAHLEAELATWPAAIRANVAKVRYTTVHEMRLTLSLFRPVAVAAMKEINEDADPNN